MTDPARSGAGSSAHSRRDGQVFLAVAAVCVLMVGGLAVISHGSPSAAQFDSVALVTPVITADEGCANFGALWTEESGVEAPIDAIEGLTNCRLSDDGQWFVPDGGDDPRLSDRSRLTPEEEAAVEPLRSLLLQDLTSLEQTLPRSLKESLGVNYAEENLPVFGHTKRGRTDFSPKRARYQRITQAFMLSPQRVYLAEYVGWVMKRRAIAIAQFETVCAASEEAHYLLRACFGMRGEFNIAAVPILWDLTDPVLLQEYLAFTARSGEPLPVETPTATISQERDSEHV